MAQSPFGEGGKPLDIIIVGGSVAGPMAGILLKRSGHNVTILEKAASSEREGLAAGVGQAVDIKRFFEEHDLLKDTPIGVLAQGLEFLDQKTLEVTRTVPYKARMVTWDAMYYRLRANFDGLASSYNPSPPNLTSDKGTAKYETGKNVLDVRAIGDSKLQVISQDVKTGETQHYTADIVIAADGANSSTRRKLQPSLRYEQPGYVLWRGTVPTSLLSRELLDKIENRTILYQMRYSYIILYTIPGQNGSLKDGEREINFAWYTWYTSRSHRDEILTDTDGRTHRTTLPKGKMNPDIWSAQSSIAKKLMHPHIFEIISKIDEPFVSVISSHCSKQAAFFNNRLFIVGDALVQPQPNSGMGTNLAAKGVLLLVDVIAGKMESAEWERQVLEDGERERLFSRAFAALRLCTWWGIGVAMLRWRWYILRLSCWRLWRQVWVRQQKAKEA